MTYFVRRGRFGLSTLTAHVLSLQPVDVSVAGAEQLLTEQVSVGEAEAGVAVDAVGDAGLAGRRLVL